MSLSPARQKKTLGLALAAGLASSMLALGGVTAPSQASGTDTTTDSLRIGSYNIRIGASMDNFLRAFDVETGRELWKGRLPAGGQATPMSYEANGRQFVVIAAGGHGKLGTMRGDYVVAFALPK